MNRMNGMAAMVLVWVPLSQPPSRHVCACICVLKNFNRRFSYHLNYHMHTHKHTKARIPFNDVCKCIVREYVYPKYMHTLYAKSSMKICLSNISIDFFKATSKKLFFRFPFPLFFVISFAFKSYIAY